jgi:outer membrane lipoprotein-sorting protein
MRFITALVTATLLLFLPACGDSGEPDVVIKSESPADIVAGAPEATTAAGTAHFTMKMAATGGAQSFEINAEGGIDYAKQRMAMTMTMPSLPGAPAGGQKMEMLTDGAMVYMKIPNGAALGMKTPWMKMDVAAMAGGAGGLGGLNNDPSSNMEMLRGVTDDIQEVGTEDIGGAPTTHYKGTMDLKKALKLSPKATQQRLRANFAKLGTTKMPTDIWIDADGRLRRQTFTMDMSKMEGGGAPGMPTGMEATVDLFDFGKPIEFKLPPKGQVTDFKGKLPGT